MPPQRPTTLVEHLRAYIVRLRTLNYSPRSIEDMLQSLQRDVTWLANTFGIEKPDALAKRHLEAWQEHLCTRVTSKGLPLRPATINKTIAFFKSFLKYLAAGRYIPHACIEALQRVKEPPTLPRSVLTHAQVKKLLARIDTATPAGYRNRTILELLYSSGLRAREALGLDVANIDFDHATAMVLGKGRKERVVPVGRTALRFLRSYIVAVRPYLVRDPSEKALFLDAAGQRLAYDSLRHWLRRFADGLGLDVHVTAHTLRRSCATEMIRADANLYHVKELLGHESLKTLTHYTKLTITDLKRTHQKTHPRERDERA